MNYYPIYVRLFEFRNLYDKNHTFDFVIRPLLDNCIDSDICVRKGFGYEKLYTKYGDILIKENGKYKFNVSKECINRYKKLWNGYEASIILVLKEDFDLFSKIFENTYRVGEMGTPNAGGYPISSVKKCKEEMEKGNIAVRMTGDSDGRSLYIYTKRHDKLLKLAKNKCKESEMITLNKIMEICKKKGEFANQVHDMTEFLKRLPNWKNRFQSYQEHLLGEDILMELNKGKKFEKNVLKKITEICESSERTISFDNKIHRMGGLLKVIASYIK